MQKIQNMLLKLFAIIILTGIIGCGGGGENTPPPSNIPIAPVNVSAQAGNEQVIITWDAVAGATSYNIYWSNTSGVKKATGAKIGNVTSPYIHDNLINGTIYYYVITAVNSAGESPESNEVFTAPSFEPPPPLQ